MDTSEPPGPETQAKGWLIANVLILVVLGIAFLAMHFVATTWGVVYLFLGWMGVGAVCGFILGVCSSMNPFIIWQCTRFGVLPGFVVAIITTAIFSTLGYDDDVGKKEKLAQEAAQSIFALESAVRSAADQPAVSLGRLPAKISSCCSTAHRNDKRRTIELLTTLCGDANPRVRGLSVIAISEIEDRSAHAVILARSKDDAPLVRASSAVALSKARPFLDDIAEALLGMLKDRDDGVRMSAALAVREAMPLLDENWQAIESDLPSFDPRVSAIVGPALRRELDELRRVENALELQAE